MQDFVNKLILRKCKLIVQVYNGWLNKESITYYLVGQDLRTDVNPPTKKSYLIIITNLLIDYVCDFFAANSFFY